MHLAIRPLLLPLLPLLLLLLLLRAAQPAAAQPFPSGKLVDVGLTSTCVVRGGLTHCFGANHYGQLGIGNDDGVSHLGAAGIQALPALVFPTEAGPIGKVSAGFEFNCAMGSNSKFYCWGHNKYGVLAQRGGLSPGHAFTPTIASEVPVGVADIQVNDNHGCLLTTAGGVRCWGSGVYGRTGHFQTYDHVNDQPDELYNVPDLPFSVTFAAREIATGEGHSCALFEGKTMICWGANGDGQCGQGNNHNIVSNWDTNLMPSLPPIAFNAAAPDIEHIYCGMHITCALWANNKISCWGSDFGSGRLGRGSDVQSVGWAPNQMANDLVEIDFGADMTILQADFMRDHGCVLLSTASGSKKVKCWGVGSRGRLGTNAEQNVGDQANEIRDQPTIPFADSANMEPVSVAVGGGATCVFFAPVGTNGGSDNSRKLRCFGSSDHGELGYGHLQHLGGAPGHMEALGYVPLPAICANNNGYVNPYEPCMECDNTVSTTEFTFKTDVGGVRYCRINDQCVLDGTVNPDDACQSCDVTKNTLGWYEQPNSCLIDGVCYSDNDLRTVDGAPWNCERCWSATDRFAWTFTPTHCRFDEPSATLGYLCLAQDELVVEPDGPNNCEYCDVPTSQTVPTFSTHFCRVPNPFAANEKGYDCMAPGQMMVIDGSPSPCEYCDPYTNIVNYVYSPNHCRIARPVEDQGVFDRDYVCMANGETPIVDGTNSPCEYCNPAADIFTLQYSTDHCRAPRLETDPANFDRDYVCLAQNEIFGERPCTRCVAESSGGPNGGGHTVSDDALGCDNGGSTCNSFVCRQGECTDGVMTENVAETFSELRCSLAIGGCEAFAVGSASTSSDVAGSGEPLVDSYSMAFVIRREAGLEVRALGHLIGDNAALGGPVTVSLYEANSGTEIETFTFADGDDQVADAHLTRAGLHMVRKFDTVVQLPAGFEGHLVVTGVADGRAAVRIPEPVAFSESMCTAYERADVQVSPGVSESPSQWIEWTSIGVGDVTLAGAIPARRFCVDSFRETTEPLVFDLVRDIEPENLSEIPRVSVWSNGAAGGVPFSSTTEAELVGLGWAGPSQTTISPDGSLILAGYVAGGNSSAVRLEGDEGTLGSSASSIIVLHRATQDGLLDLTDSSLLAVDTDIAVRVYVNDNLINTTTAFVGQRQSFNTHLADVLTGDRVLVVLTPLVGGTPAAFEAFSFDVRTASGGTLVSSYNREFSRQPRGSWDYLSDIRVDAVAETDIDGMRRLDFEPDSGDGSVDITLPSCDAAGGFAPSVAVRVRVDMTGPKQTMMLADGSMVVSNGQAIDIAVYLNDELLVADLGCDAGADSNPTVCTWLEATSGLSLQVAHSDELDVVFSLSDPCSPGDDVVQLLDVQFVLARVVIDAQIGVIDAGPYTRCLIDGVCVQNELRSPENECLACKPLQSVVDWSVRFFEECPECEPGAQGCICAADAQCKADPTLPIIVPLKSPDPVTVDEPRSDPIPPPRPPPAAPAAAAFETPERLPELPSCGTRSPIDGAYWTSAKNPLAFLAPSATSLQTFVSDLETQLGSTPTMSIGFALTDNLNALLGEMDGTQMYSPGNCTDTTPCDLSEYVFGSTENRACISMSLPTVLGAVNAMGGTSMLDISTSHGLGIVDLAESVGHLEVIVAFDEVFDATQESWDVFVRQNDPLEAIETYMTWQYADLRLNFDRLAVEVEGRTSFVLPHTETDMGTYDFVLSAQWEDAFDAVDGPTVLGVFEATDDNQDLQYLDDGSRLGMHLSRGLMDMNARYGVFNASVAVHLENLGDIGVHDGQQVVLHMPREALGGRVVPNAGSPRDLLAQDPLAAAEELGLIIPGIIEMNTDEEELELIDARFEDAPITDDALIEELLAYEKETATIRLDGPLTDSDTVTAMAESFEATFDTVAVDVAAATIYLSGVADVLLPMEMGTFNISLEAVWDEEAQFDGAATFTASLETNSSILAEVTPVLNFTASTGFLDLGERYLLLEGELDAAIFLIGSLAENAVGRLELNFPEGMFDGEEVPDGECPEEESILDFDFGDSEEGEGSGSGSGSSGSSGSGSGSGSSGGSSGSGEEEDEEDDGDCPAIEVHFGVRLVEEEEDPTLITIVPTVLRAGVSILSYEPSLGIFRASGLMELGLPVLGPIGTFAMSLEVTPDEASFILEAVEPIALSLIDGKISIQMTGGYVTATIGEDEDSGAEMKYSVVALTGLVDLPVLGEISAVTEVRWEVENEEDSKYFSGDPAFVITLAQQDPLSLVDILVDLKIPRSAIDPLPIPELPVRISNAEIDLTNQVLTLQILVNEDDKLVLVQDVLSISDVSIDAVVPMRDVSEGVEVTVAGDFGLGSAEVAYINEEWWVQAYIARVSVADIVYTLGGDLVQPLKAMLRVLDMSDVEFATVLGGEDKQQFFRIGGSPDALNGRIEMLTGKIGDEDKRMTAVMASISPMDVFGWIAAQLNFPNFRIPFPTIAPIDLVVSDTAVEDTDDELPLQFSYLMENAPSSVDEGFTISYTLTLDGPDCGAACRSLKAIMPGLNSVFVSIGVADQGKYRFVNLAAALDLNLELGVFSLNNLEFQLSCPIPRASGLAVYLATQFDIEVSRSQIVEFEFKVGFNAARKAFIINAVMTGFIERVFGLPFVTIGNCFLELEVTKAPTFSFGAWVALGHDCIADGEYDPRAGCVEAQMAIGIGADQFLYFRASGLKLKRIVNIFGKGKGALLPPLIGDIGFTDPLVMSFSGSERTLPTGEYVAAGLVFEGGMSILGTDAVFLRVQLPVTPAMIAMVTGIGYTPATPSQLIQELLTGLNLVIEVRLPAINWFGGLFVIAKSSDELHSGPFFLLEADIQPLAPSYDFRVELKGYISILKFFTFEADILITKSGFRTSIKRDFAGVKSVMLVESRGRSPIPLFNQWLVSASMDMSQFNEIVLSKINWFVNTLIDAAVFIFEKIPFVGNLLVKAANIVRRIFLLRVDYIGISFQFGPRTLGFGFELDAVIFGFNVNVDVEVAISIPDDFAGGLFSGLLGNRIKNMFTNRGGGIWPQCGPGRDQELLICYPTCRAGYSGIAITCWEDCRHGYTDLLVMCSHATVRGIDWCCKVRIFGKCVFALPCCPHGFANLGFMCLKIDLYFKALYFRLPNGIASLCHDQGKTSWEFYGLPLCFHQCHGGHFGAFNQCVDPIWTAFF